MTYRTALFLTLGGLYGCGGSSADADPVAEPPEASAGGEEAPAAEGPERYRIVLVRRPSVGDRWREQVDSAGRTVTPTRERTRHYAIDATIEAVEAAADRDVLRVAIAEHVHTDWRGGDRNRGLPPGTVLVVQRQAGRTHIERDDGTPLQQIFIQQLEDVIEVSLQIEGEDDDTFFQTHEPRAVGERWPMSEAVLAQSLRGQTIDRSEVTLVRVEDVDGVPSAVLTAEIEAHAGRETTHITWEIVAPLDPRRPIARHHRTIVTEDPMFHSRSVYEKTRTRTLL